MSTYQGTCGAEGCSAPVITSVEAQPSAGQNSSLRSAAIIYNETVRKIRNGGEPRFASHTDYLKYKRAQALASGSAHIACRPPPCDAIRQIEATGCPCDTIGEGELTFEFGSPSIPYPDPAYNGYLSGSWTAFPNSTSYIVTCDYPKDYVVVFTGSKSAEIYLKDFVGETVVVSVISNSYCSLSVSTTVIFCFLAGTPVALADGTSKPIEAVAVGDRVIGAFGEINTVTGTISNELGDVPIININGEHKTTAPHPHIAADHTLQCVDTVSLTKFAYGKKFPITGADGAREARVIKGVSESRIKQLEVGSVLQTLTGARKVTSLETIHMPPSTRVYHLTTDGSHSYTVDGYAVAGGATEEDFDYDSWTVRA